jgi:hypothetical protein
VGVFAMLLLLWSGGSAVLGSLVALSAWRRRVRRERTVRHAL